MLLFWFLELVLCFFFFFFQAEDGIRDGRVTGVQTCALPICGRRADRRATWHRSGDRDRWPNVPVTQDAGRRGPHRRHWDRSEERRVGKECRSGWWAYH